jgi:hypothetical protein
MKPRLAAPLLAAALAAAPGVAQTERGPYARIAVLRPHDDDERDNILNVAPHVEWAGNAIYEFLPDLSRGTGEPSPAARVELTTVDLVAGASKGFETALAATASALRGETLWYRMAAGGPVPRYVRLRPRPRLSAILEGRSEQDLPEAARAAVAKTTVEILTLRPTMSLGLPPPARE